MDEEAAVEKRIEIFSDTQDRVKNNDELRKLTAKAAGGSRLYSEDYKFKSCAGRDEKVQVSVVNEMTFNAAKKLKEKYKKTAVLNFACATNPGGGVVTGSKGQEENLCMCSNLYQCLYQQNFWESFYGFYKRLGSPYHGDKIIFSPGVTVFKREEDFPVYTEEWFDVDVITSAAPDLGWVKSYKDDVVYKVLKKRIRAILNVALDNGEDAVVLGAFGCGKFCNPPEIVAESFKEVIEECFMHSFKEIVFAVYGLEKKDLNNYRIFKEAFEK